MTSEWQYEKLGDITTNLDAKRKPVKEADRKHGPYPYYGASGIVDYVEDYLFDGEHLLIAEDGENLRTRQTPIAFRATGKFWVNNHAHIVIGNQRASTRYLEYAVQGTDISAYLTGAVMPKLTQGNLNRIEVPCPPRVVQDLIVAVLGNLDDRITLLRETNQTLEAIAQALFKSWFVDFDPVRAKAEGKVPEGIDAATAALFPDAFGETELGLVPRGWQIGSLASVSDVGIGKTPPRKEAHWFSESPQDVRWVSIRDMGSSGAYISSTTEYLTAEAVDKFNVRRIPDKTVLLSFKMTIGRVSITDGEMTTNEAIAHCKLTQNSPVCSEYIYLHLKQFDYASLSSTSSIADAVNSKTVKAIPILVPSTEVHSAFKKVTDVLFEKIKTNHQQTQALVTLRDTLMPRLISGQLRVAEAEAELEKAMA